MVAKNDSMHDKDVERFGRWASTYEQSSMQRWLFGPAHKRMLDLLAAYGPATAPQQVVDVGCGTGRLLRAVELRWPEAGLIGVDAAAGMVEEARRLNPRAQFENAAAESLPLPDASVDLVLSSISFHHWADQGKGVREVARILRPGGWFCLADHEFLLGRLWGDKVRTRDEIRTLMSAAGLNVRKQAGWVIRFVQFTLAQK